MWQDDRGFWYWGTNSDNRGPFPTYAAAKQNADRCGKRGDRIFLAAVAVLVGLPLLAVFASLCHP